MNKFSKDSEIRVTCSGQRIYNYKRVSGETLTGFFTDTAAIEMLEEKEYENLDLVSPLLYK